MTWLPVPHWYFPNGIPWGGGTIVPALEAAGFQLGAAIGDVLIASSSG